MFQHTCILCLLTFHFAAGELPKELGNLVNLTLLYLCSNAFQGKSYAPTHMHCMFTDILSSFTGELPKQLPVSLVVLNLGDSFGNTNKFTGGIPPEWGALTNLKELKMAYCGLDGEICMSQHTCVCAFTFKLTAFSLSCR